MRMWTVYYPGKSMDSPALLPDASRAKGAVAASHHGSETHGQEWLRSDGSSWLPATPADLDRLLRSRC